MAGNANKYIYSAEEAIEKLYQKSLISDTNTGFLQNLIDSYFEYEANAYFWQEHFILDGNEYPANLADKTLDPAWTVRSKTNRVVSMADAMAPLSETAQLDNEGFETRTGSIYQYGKGLYQNSLNKIELEARLREFDPYDRNLINGFAKGVADLVKSNNYRLSNLSGQALSMGGAYNNETTRGWSGVSVSQNSYIPPSNFLKAGTKVWTDADCNIPEQMQKIEYDFKTAKGLPESTPFEWDIPYDMLINVLLKNKFFIAEVNKYVSITSPQHVIIVNSNGTTNYDQSFITMDQLLEYTRWAQSKISPIRVVKESQTVQNITTYTTVKGWKEGVAVLRPLGYAGVIVHAMPNDVALYSSGEVNDNVQIGMAKASGFLYVINKVVPNGMLKAYHTDVIGRYAPVLNEINEHAVIDTTTAS